MHDIVKRTETGMIVVQLNIMLVVQHAHKKHSSTHTRRPYFLEPRVMSTLHDDDNEHLSHLLPENHHISFVNNNAPSKHAQQDHPTLYNFYAPPPPAPPPSSTESTDVSTDVTSTILPALANLLTASTYADTSFRTATDL